jgi:hypothetical protein
MRGIETTKTYVSEVRSGAFPAAEHTFGLHKSAGSAGSVAAPTVAASTEPDAVPVTEAHAYGPTQ